MATYNLQPNEFVLLTENSVSHGGFLSGYTRELILTNVNLVLVEKGFFGKSKGVRAFPLNRVKVHDGQAQALVGKATNGSSVLDVYFVDGQARFAFQTGGRKKVLLWVAKIDEAVTGRRSSQVEDAGGAIPGAEVVADMVKDTVDVFRSAFQPAKDEPATVSDKCRSCGAPLRGARGATVACEYCGGVQGL